VKAFLRRLCYRTLVRGLCWLPRNRPLRSYRQILIKLDRLGDAVLAISALRYLIQEADEGKTLLIVSPIAAPLMRMEFPGVDVLVLPAFCPKFWPDFVTFWLRHADELRGLRAGRVVCLRHQRSDFTRSILHLIEADQRYLVDWQKEWEAKALPDMRSTGAVVLYPDTAKTCLELEAHRRVVEAATGRPVSLCEMYPALSKVSVRPGLSLLVCPLAGDSIRCYPPPLLARSLAVFQQASDSPIELCIPPGENAEPWRAALAEAGIAVAKWHCPTDLAALIELIAGAGAVLAPDSAPAHLAIALNKPGVFLLGGGHYQMFAPWQKHQRQIWLHQPMPCFGCRWSCVHPVPYCITEIAPERVAEALGQVIAQDG